MRYVLALLLIIFDSQIVFAITITKDPTQDKTANPYCELDATFERETIKEGNPKKVLWIYQVHNMRPMGASVCPVGNTVEVSMRGAVYDNKLERFFYGSETILPPKVFTRATVRVYLVDVNNTLTKKSYKEWLLRD